MAEIKPFRAIIYNKDKISGLSKVVCPPYDVISPAAQEHYYGMDPYNFIHILLRKDAPGEDNYAAAGESFRQWFKEKVFIRDEPEAIYFYSHQYKIKGESKTRLGFVALLQLDDENSSVFGHEHTRMPAKEDRLKLLRQAKANLSPIFIIFLDKRRIIQYTYQNCVKDREPLIDVIDEEKNTHRIWRLDSPEILENLRQKLRQEDIFIADGHHRYEVACAYREEMKEKLGKITGRESFNYILAYFTNTDPRGLSILPIHRLVKEDLKPDFNSFMDSLGSYFDREEVKEKDRFFFLLEKSGCSQNVLGMYKDKKFYLLRLKNIKILDTFLSDKPKECRSLDVSILNEIIFKNILGLDAQMCRNIEFNPDPDKVIREADKNPSNTAFFLNPVRIQEVIAVASAGQRMPAKSTYFYPKVLSGLLINKLE